MEMVAVIVGLEGVRLIPGTLSLKSPNPKFEALAKSLQAVHPKL